MTADLREPGDICVCKIGGLGGPAVDFMEWLNGAAAFSHWDHVLAYVGDGKCLQAEPDGAQIIERPVLPGDLWSTGIPVFALTAGQQAMVPDVAQTFDGTGYSWLDYAALAARRLRIPNLPLWPDAGHLVTLRAFIKASGHEMCSMLVDAFRLRLGSHLFADGRWEGDVTPWDIGHLLAGAGAHGI